MLMVPSTIQGIMGRRLDAGDCETAQQALARTAAATRVVVHDDCRAGATRCYISLVDNSTWCTRVESRPFNGSAKYHDS